MSWWHIAHTTDFTDVYISGEMTNDGSRDLVDELRAHPSPAVVVHIDSSGGDAFASINLYSALRQHPATVTANIGNMCFGAATAVAAAADRIIVGRGTQISLHSSIAGIEGDARNMREMADLLNRTDQAIAQIYADRFGGSPQQWLYRMRAETWYTADQAVAAGLADEIAGETT